MTLFISPQRVLISDERLDLPRSHRVDLLTHVYTVGIGGEKGGLNIVIINC